MSRIAKPGRIICLRLSDSVDALESCGVLVELLTDGLIFDTDSGTEWIRAQDIHSWKLPKSRNSPTITPHETSPESSIASPEGSPARGVEPEKPVSTASAEFLPKPAANNLPSTADLELFFAGDPILPRPEPSFSFPSLPKDIQQNIIRWKNRYDYARKVREPARMSQDVPRIAELAETLQDPSLYFLAGLLADSSGLSSSRTRTCFQKALELDQNRQDISIALAALGIRENDWSSAVKFLLWAVYLEGETDKTNLVRCIGQCVLLLNNANPQPIGLLLSLELPETARRLASSLIALAAKEDADVQSDGVTCRVTGSNLESCSRVTVTGSNLESCSRVTGSPIGRQ